MLQRLQGDVLLPYFEPLQGGQGYSGLASELGIRHLTTLFAQKPTELLLEIRHAWDSESGDFSHVGILLVFFPHMGKAGLVSSVWIINALFLNAGKA